MAILRRGGTEPMGHSGATGGCGRAVVDRVLASTSVVAVGRPVPLVGDAVPLVGDAVAVIGHALALVSGPLPLVGEVLALLGGVVALVRDAVALLGGDLSPVERRPALRQVGPGGLQGPFSCLGPPLGLRDPEIVQSQGGQPLALGLLDDLAGQLGQLAGGGSGAGSELPERDLGVGALGGGQDPFGLLDPDP